MPINAHPDFFIAQGEYNTAQNIEDKLRALEKMISLAPAHKGGENLRAQLKARYKKLKGELERTKKTRKGFSKAGIKKEDMQTVIVGKTKSGKSSLLSVLTNAQPLIADYNYTTKSPVIGMMIYSGVQIQIIEIPAIESEYYDRGVVNTTDTILILVDKLEDIKFMLDSLERAKGKKIIVYNKVDILTDSEKRRIEATLKSKKYNFVLISTKTKEGIPELKEKIFKGFDMLRVYTKEPGKAQAVRATILPPRSTVKDIAEKIFHGFSKNIKETRITGPSSKFPNQKVGLAHELKDMDVVEFKTK